MHKMLEHKKAIIFDLDGTMIDSMWMWRTIDIEYLGKFGIPLPEDLQACIEGMSFRETAVYVKNRFQIPDSLETIQEDWNNMAWDKYTNEVPLKEKAKDFLQYCKEAGIKLGIATSNSAELVENILNVHNIADYFSAVITGSEVTKGKPAPDIYLEVAGRLGCEPSACLVFEDIIPGIMAGKNAGMQVCAVEDAYSADKRKEKQLLADYYIDSYDELFID